MAGIEDTELDGSHHVSSDRLLQTAKFLADAKSSLLEDLNVDNIRVSNAYNNGSANIGDQQGERPLRTISKGSKVRADRVRSYMHFFYHLIEEEVASGQSNSAHEGVEGTYNPLQVIRNRKAKKKLHQQLRNDISFMKPPILAIRDFSKSQDRDFPWFVDVSERSGDLAWRISNWDQLRRPDGKRWFVKEHKSRSHSATLSSRSYPSQFYRNNRISNHSRASSLVLPGKSSSNWELPLIAVESVDQDAEESFPSSENKYEKMRGKTKRLSRSTLHSRSNSQQQINLDINGASKSAGHNQVPYSTPTEPTTNHGNASEVHIKSVRNRFPEHRSISGDSNKASYEFLELQEPLQHDQKATILQAEYNELKYLRCTWQVMKNRQGTLNILETKNAEKASKTVFEDPAQFCKSAEKVINDYRDELTQALKTCDIWKSKLLNDYAIRVENLISSSDRVLSDINTTLTLRLKLLQEKIDKFGTLNRMNKEPLKMFLYRVLEVFIVILFWGIWFVFTIMKSAKIMILTLLKVIRLAVW
ncbi:LANO_0F10088g1_1 [Lachancea nothofagi CBS 11611]|uniref:LANO_0F10088g1_1 n=1 Tax=Lachancea nothofagi CBS 11611 TaxID=1266666 RepID=A0A1G4KA82_9SACH|nr:LANO_0F10088g1_1 [Lachancea nothofagi CBS 11611]